METSIIKIGNSRGLRLSKTILEKGQILLKPVVKPRYGWEVAFEKMRAENDDHLLIDDVFDNEIFEEWK